jgi:hypothetical protein
LEASLPALDALASAANDSRPKEAGERLARWLAEQIGGSLEGNLGDLSMWPVGGAVQKGEQVQAEAGRSHLLVDDRQAAADYLADGVERVDFVLDNAGLELASDLALADALLCSQAAGQVVFNLKAHPTFVSDAMEFDVHAAVRAFSESEHPAAQALGRRLESHLSAGKLLLTWHFFWNSPLPLWEMPADLHLAMDGSGLWIFKGDANYRRILGDRHWPQEAAFADLTRYRPDPLLALRVLKSEIVVGLQPGQAQAASQKDPQWMIDGKWGLIQFAR